MFSLSTILFAGTLVITGIVAYLFGSINSSIIVGKFYKIDIREHGSGNAGLTNTLRTLGKKAAIFVLLGDVLKGVLAILFAKLAVPFVLDLIVGNASNMDEFIQQRILVASIAHYSILVAGIMVIIGHIFPVFYNFKGGKGVLTSITVIFMIEWQIGLACLAIFVIVVALTRYVSLGSVLAAFSFPFLIIALDRYIDVLPDFSGIAFACILSIIVIWGHRGNLVRLWNNTERKLGEKKEDYEKRINKEKKLT